MSNTASVSHNWTLTTKSETRNQKLNLKLQDLQIKITTQRVEHFLPEDRGGVLIIPVGPNNNVADVQYEEVGIEAEGLVPRRREGVNESWKLNEKYGNVLCLAVTPNGHSSMSKDPRDYFKPNIARACSWHENEMIVLVKMK